MRRDSRTLRLPPEESAASLATQQLRPFITLVARRDGGYRRAQAWRRRRERGEKREYTPARVRIEKSSPEHKSDTTPPAAGELQISVMKEDIYRRESAEARWYICAARMLRVIRYVARQKRAQQQARQRGAVRAGSVYEAAGVEEVGRP